MSVPTYFAYIPTRLRFNARRYETGGQETPCLVFDTLRVLEGKMTWETEPLEIQYPLEILNKD